MRELIRLKMQSYTPRLNLIQALNEAGYGTRVEEVKSPFPSSFSTYFVVVYETKDPNQLGESA